MHNRPWIRFLIIIVCLYLIVTTVQAIADLWKAGDKEVERQKNLAALQAQQQKLLAEKSKAQTQEYWEKIARNELGMSRPGEQVLVVPKDLLKDNTVAVTPDVRPNWQKWLDLIL